MLHAICSASGQTCFGQSIPARDVLHLALEDTRCRYKDRARKMVDVIGPMNLDRLEVRTNWPRAGSGGLTRLSEWMKNRPGALVIIDTLARFRDPTKGRGNSYEQDYAAVSKIKTLADTYGASIEFVARKGAADDPFDEVSGTLGINGAADAIMVLDRHARGRPGGAVPDRARPARRDSHPDLEQGRGIVVTRGARRRHRTAGPQDGSQQGREVRRLSALRSLGLRLP